MKQKNTPIERPSRKPYIVCDLGQHGSYTFKLPSPGHAQKLMENYSSVNQEDMAEVEAAAGELIRSCWADGTYDLEGGTGAEVFTELWERGWSFQLLLGLVAALVGQMNEAFISETEVSEQVSFFGVSPGKSTSDTSDTPTSETSGGSGS